MVYVYIFFVYTTYIFGDDWWMVYYCFTHIKATQMVVLPTNNGSLIFFTMFYLQKMWFCKPMI